MEYKAKTCVWEITVACNMRCKHCGSSCTIASKDELTTDEAIEVCRQMGDLGVEWVTLSGGEPTTRKDWDVIAKSLSDNGIIPSMITNGWLLDEKMIEKAENSGINTIAISIDGNKQIHDFIRKSGAFEKALSGLDLIKNSKVHSAVITTINSKNIDILEEIKNIFIEHGVESWQLQFGLPMGNLSNNEELLISPEMVDRIIDFAYETSLEGKINIDLADCIGYYNLKEIEVRKKSEEYKNDQCVEYEYDWNGCLAGKFGFGLLNNGDVVACTSIRSKDFIEGNIRRKSLSEIWNDKNSFKWNRDLTKEQLGGKCQKCKYGQACKGGCSNSRLTMNGTIYSENKYCSYNIALTKAENSLNKINSVNDLLEKSEKFIENNNYQLAEIALTIANNKEKKNIPILNRLSYINYILENYKRSKEFNECVLDVNPNECYAVKGLGLCLIELGDIELGLKYLYKSIDLVDGEYLDPYYDLAITLLKLGNKEEAINIIESGVEKYSELNELKKNFYQVLEEIN